MSAVVRSAGRFTLTVRHTTPGAANQYRVMATEGPITEWTTWPLGLSALRAAAAAETRATEAAETRAALKRLAAARKRRTRALGAARLRAPAPTRALHRDSAQRPTIIGNELDQCHITIAAAAELLGVSRSHAGSVINVGHRIGSRRLRQDLADLVGRPVDALFDPATGIARPITEGAS